jgi:hypothetical protein
MDSAGSSFTQRLCERWRGRKNRFHNRTKLKRAVERRIARNAIFFVNPPVKPDAAFAHLFSLQKPLVPEFTVMIDLVVILDGIDIDKFEAFAQTGWVG